MQKSDIKSFVDFATQHWSSDDREALRSDILHGLDDDAVAAEAANYAKAMSRNREMAYDGLVCAMAGFLAISAKPPRNLSPSVN